MGNEPLWMLLLKVFVGPLVAGIVAAGITYWFSRRRFIQERWWDRKADAYGKIIGSLVSVEYAYECLMENETVFEGDEEDSLEVKEDLQGIVDECNEAWSRLERAAAEGDYVVSEKVATALAELVRGKETIDPSELMSALRCHRDEIGSCLKFVRAEARSDLGVK